MNFRLQLLYFIITVSSCKGNLDLRKTLDLTLGAESQNTVMCNHGTESEGVCVSSAACANFEGRAEGSCKNEFASTFPYVCCKYETSCGSETEEAVSYFMSPDYPEPQRDDLSCTNTITVRKNVCQLRLDFIDFDLPIPNDDGSCRNTDNMAIHNTLQPYGVLGKGSSKFCGLNSGQHLYLPAMPTDTLTMVATLSGTAPVPLSYKRNQIASSYSEYKWMLKITQIECDTTWCDKDTRHYFNDLRAPGGCLQYFFETRGRLTSFNFDGTAIFGPAQDYSICIKDIRRSCGITLRSYNFGLPCHAQGAKQKDCETGLCPASSNDETGHICCNDIDGNGQRVDDSEAYFGVYSSLPRRYRYCGRNFGTVDGHVEANAHGPYTIHVFSGKNIPFRDYGVGFSIEYDVESGIC